MACVICACALNNAARTAVTCFKCEFVACKACVRQYLMTCHAKPKCMNCSQPFMLNYLVTNLNRSWVNETYKPVLQENFMGAELGLLPETTPFAEAEKERRALKKQSLEYQQRIAKLAAQIKRYEYAIIANRYRIRGEPVPARFLNDLTTGPSVTIDVKKRYIMACPSQGCKGFLSSGYKCSLCEKHVCSDCLVVKAEGHACVESDRLSAELIKHDTRPCPTCGQRIFKIDGCDQMFCTNRVDGAVCGTAFSWKTGAKETGVIHNPHFYELQRQQGVAIRNVGDVQCGGMPNLGPFLHGLDTIEDMRALGFRAEVRTKHRHLSEMIVYTVNDVRERLRRFTDTRDLRVQYMLNDITADKFRELLFKHYKEHQKLTELYHIMELISVSSIETFIDLVETMPRRIDPGQADTLFGYIQERLKALDGIRLYVNEQLKLVSINYNCTVRVFNPDFAQVSKKYTISGGECR